MNPKESIIYFAASLFNGRESYFNSHLTALLEKRFEKINLPQREGFEFGNLNKELVKFMPQEEASSALKKIIYLYDLGKMELNSDLILANLDEPLDPGVDIELCFGKEINIPRIGFRTDVRPVYGTLDDETRGGHFFPIYQCDSFIHHAMPCKTLEEANSNLEQLANKIEKAVLFTEKTNKRILSPSPNAKNIMTRANYLFSMPHDVHSEQGLKTISQRYFDSKDEIDLILPKIIR
ncbi:MAG: nucleoside 2-deoxyribosyltransferase [Nanoarchaeota archaeon]|nr:nucleoside 2-deoxyribosyltransferase [Nanoarchaeota archaeon]